VTFDLDLDLEHNLDARPPADHDPGSVPAIFGVVEAICAKKFTKEGITGTHFFKLCGA